MYGLLLLQQERKGPINILQLAPHAPAGFRPFWELRCTRPPRAPGFLRWGRSR